LENIMSSERWEIDGSHSSIHFSVRHLVIAKVRGQFSRWSGAVDVPDGDFSRASVDIVIDASSIDTGVPDRDGHLKSADFLDVAQFPELTFVSRRVEPAGDDRFRLTGELTIKGVTRLVTLDGEDAGRAKDHRDRDRGACTRGPCPTGTAVG
jgi:polyisoprenoid-binding protein YceI